MHLCREGAAAKHEGDRLLIAILKEKLGVLELVLALVLEDLDQLLIFAGSDS